VCVFFLHALICVLVCSCAGDDWGVVNDDPEGEGWFVKAAPQSPNPELMDSDKYKQFLETSA
jgi:glycine cleavage system H lipoate-binding protein